LVPSADWKRKVQGETWFPGETISVSIGQGPVLVTPLQVAALTACVANRGMKIRPRVTRDDGQKAPEQERTGLDSDIFEK